LKSHKENEVKSVAISVTAGPASGIVGYRAILLGAIFAILQAVALPARSAPDSFADLAEAVSAAVVNITTSTEVPTPLGPAPTLPEGSPFEDFFEDFFNRNGPRGGPQQRNALGSGFVISADGFVVTNNHVIEGADEILVELFSGEELEAEIVGTDRDTDIALLKVESREPLQFVAFGDSDAARVGDWVMAMGNPLGQGFSVSAGIISAHSRALSGAYDDFIQTDAAINRGNSGGPLFNMDGDVIGVNTAILSPTGGSIGIGFAMSSAVVEPVIAQLMEFGETRRGWLGVRIQDVTDEFAEALGLDEPVGALVSDVPEGPAADAGIIAGDVIVSFGGSEVSDSRDLVNSVGKAEIGRNIPVSVFRDGETMTLMVTMGRRETARDMLVDAGDAPKPSARGAVLGLMLRELDSEFIENQSLTENAEGLYVSEVDQESAAWSKGIRPGDLIIAAGGQPSVRVSDIEDRVDEARKAGRKSLLLLLKRDDDPRFVALPLEE